LRNDFSAMWYSVFLDPIPAQDSEAETAFVLRHLPPQEYPSLLDLCCGPGRHALRLAAHGYDILGIDKNTQAIAQAQQHAVLHTRFLAHDMRDLHTIGATFDGVLNLWHSFGYFDDATNQDILRQIHGKLRPGGRLILDIYNRASLERFPARRQFEKEGVQIVAEYSWSGKRATCTLTYDGALHDTFEWRIYTPDEIHELAATLGFRCLVACAWFNEQLAPSAEHARMQFVLEREGRI
jgi:SAM-dependent methyltransferase